MKKNCSYLNIQNKMDKQYILDHVDELSAEKLANYIKQGLVTLDELRKTGLLDNSKRVAISRMLKADEQEQQRLEAERDKADDDAWETARYSNEISLIDWISNNPNNKYLQKAKDKVKFLQDERDKIKSQKQGILDNIRRNPNTYPPNDIKGFLRNATFTEQDLRDCGIPQSAINNLDKIKAPTLNLGATPDSIPEGYTEVYFWGYKGSGKTCALGAILQMAEKKGYLNIAAGPGNRYATQLKNIFSDDGAANDFLPAPSPVETTQYLPFTLKKPNESKIRSVSLIELSGEVFLCFAHKIANQPFPTQSHENTFNSLSNFLKSDNRKVHFFFIDFDRENKPDDDGMKQSDYLAAASTYFKNNKVFGKTTDAIYVVLTKSDLMLDDSGNPISKDKRIEYAKKHLSGHNYLAFVNTLKDICKKYSINGGKLTVEPFSLGKVFFRDICDFDGTAAANIVEILIERIAGSRISILDVFNR
ncbi:hypothetical protein IH575_04605 [Candidatus Dojkabacteria bacterium]|nr:hypothetical protein [Candidatus Dojkabacteria bacterium]